MSAHFLLKTAYPSIKPSRILYFLLVSVVLSMSSCIANRMVPFDAQAYETAKSLKNDALNLMGEATQKYSDKTADITAFQKKVQDHIAYEEARGEKNKTTVDMWKLLMNPDGNLLGGFLTKWKNDAQLSQVLVTQFKREVGENFNKIIDLENKKKK